VRRRRSQGLANKRGAEENGFGEKGRGRAATLVSVSRSRLPPALRAVVAIGAATLTGLACNALLGIEDPIDRPDSAASADASPADAAASDAPVGEDATRDAGPTCAVPYPAPGCAAGACAAEQITEVSGKIGGFAISGDYVYFTVSPPSPGVGTDTVNRVRNAPGATPEVLSSGETALGRVDVTDAWVYFLTLNADPRGSRLRRVSKVPAGSGTRSEAVGECGGACIGVATVNDTTVYTRSDDELRRFTREKDGGVGVAVVPNVGGGHALVTDDRYVYTSGVLDGRVTRAALDLSGPEVLVNVRTSDAGGLVGSADLAVDCVHLYSGGATRPSRLVRIDKVKAGDAAVVDVPLETFPLAVDARYLWYRQGFDLVRRRLPLDAASPSEVVIPNASVDFLRLTASHAFVVRYAGPVSKILRVAK